MVGSAIGNYRILEKLGSQPWQLTAAVKAWAAERQRREPTENAQRRGRGESASAFRPAEFPVELRRHPPVGRTQVLPGALA